VKNFQKLLVFEKKKKKKIGGAKTVIGKHPVIEAAG